MRRVVNRNRLRTLALLALAGALLGPHVATAFNLEGHDITMKLVLPDDNGDLTRVDPVEQDRKDYFNLANCSCNVDFGIELEIPDAPSSFADSAPVDIWAGSGCDASPENVATVRDANCEKVDTFADIDGLIGRQVLPVPMAQLLAPNQVACPTQTGTQSVYAIIDRDTAGIVDPSNTAPGDYVAPVYNINYDTEPPPLPEKVEASGGENAIQVSWDIPSVRADDVRFFQVLCARADGSVDENDGFGGGAKFLTSRMACDADVDGSHPDVDPADMPAELYNLDPSTVCATTGGTENSVRIQGLENGVDYRLVLVAVDFSRNVSAIDVGIHQPTPAEDAWEHYKEAGGHADGGYCFVATATYGNYDHPFVRILRNFRDDTLAHFRLGRDFIAWYYANSPGLAGFIASHTGARAVSYVLLAPLVAFAAVWEYTGPLGKLSLLLLLAGLLVRRRIRKSEGEALPRASHASSGKRRVLMATTSVLFLVALGASAHAQPYWDELNEPLEAGDSVPHWNAEMKLGPYYPGVDDEFSAEMGPFEEVFGSKWKLMGAVSLDRYFAFPMGQLGVTGSLGYSSRSAAAFELGPDGRPFRNSQGELVRSKGDTVGFRLLPTSLGVVYRFTGLDDNFGIPLVPYGKASLAYYLWWFTDPSGNTSESRTSACPDAGMPDSTCTGNLGRGGSLGYQATIGLALRAERLDPSAETSLRTEMGIEHAGFFIEGTLAQVDGFGASDKLTVGDTTWFGGINFEF